VIPNLYLRLVLKRHAIDPSITSIEYQSKISLIEVFYAFHSNKNSFQCRQYVFKLLWLLKKVWRCDAILFFLIIYCRSFGKFSSWYVTNEKPASRNFSASYQKNPKRVPNISRHIVTLGVRNDHSRFTCKDFRIEGRSTTSFRHYSQSSRNILYPRR